MQLKSIALCLVLAVGCAGANAPTSAGPPATLPTEAEKEVLDLSRQKWRWMAERNTQALDKLIDSRAIFVHMGATFSKSEELAVIESGRIQYKETEIQEISVRTIGDTAIVLSKIQLFALVGGNEAWNPFMVTETYVRQASEWKLASLAFTRRTNP
jgi:4-carboxymuconolactone decarboxylase